jgi:hypothetical protein
MIVRGAIMSLRLAHNHLNEGSMDGDILHLEAQAKMHGTWHSNCGANILID